MAAARVSKRQQIIRAANKLVQEQGAQHLTLDAVAAEAGISKGGLLYHFRSKNELIDGMLDDVMTQFSQELVNSHNPEEGAGSLVRAYIRTATRHDLDMDSSLLAAMVSNPERLEAARLDYKRNYERLTQDGIDPAIAIISCLAADGLWLMEMFGFIQINSDERAKLIGAMESLTRN